MTAKRKSAKRTQAAEIDAQALVCQQLARRPTRTFRAPLFLAGSPSPSRHVTRPPNHAPANDPPLSAQFRYTPGRRVVDLEQETGQ